MLELSPEQFEQLDEVTGPRSTVSAPPLNQHSERYRRQRRPTRLPVRLKNKLLGEIEGVTTDVSPGGLAVESPTPFPARTRVEVIVALPGGESAPMEATIRWADLRAGRMGLELDNLDRRLIVAAGTPGARVAPGVFVPVPDQLKRNNPKQLQRLARFRCQLPARLLINNVPQPAVVLNVSARGIAIRASGPISSKDVAIEVDLSSEQVARVSGQIVWSAALVRTCLAGIQLKRADKAFYDLVGRLGQFQQTS